MKIPKLPGVTKAVLVAALLYYIVANPMTYRLVDSLLGGLVGPIAGPSGCPTNLGVIVHAIVFGVASKYVL